MINTDVAWIERSEIQVFFLSKINLDFAALNPGYIYGFSSAVKLVGWVEQSETQQDGIDTTQLTSPLDNLLNA